MEKLSDKQFQKLVLEQQKQLEQLTDRLRNLPAKIVAGDLFALPVEERRDPLEAEQQLVERIRRGESEAWNDLITRYEGHLLAYVSRRLQNRSATEDIVQKTFIDFLNSLPNYDGRLPLESYLFSIASQKLADYLRREGRRPKISFAARNDWAKVQCLEQASELRWLFVSTTQNDSQTWIALPADDMELIGTRDVEIPDWADNGPINVRCKYRIELPASALDVELQRVGHLSADCLKQVKEKVAEIDDNFEFLAPELLAVDRNPDYVAWMENVRVEAYRVERHLQIASGQSETTWFTRIVEKAKEFFQGIIEDPGPLQPESTLGPAYMSNLLAVPVNRLFGFFSVTLPYMQRGLIFAVRPERLGETAVILGESSECILVALIFGRQLVALGAFGVLSSDPPTVHIVDDSGKRQLVRWQIEQPGIYLSDQSYKYQPDQILNWESDSIQPKIGDDSERDQTVSR